MNDINNVAKLVTNGILDYQLNNKAKNIHISVSTEDQVLIVTSRSQIDKNPADIEKINKKINEKSVQHMDTYYSELLTSSYNKSANFKLISSIVDSGKLEYNKETKVLNIELRRDFK